MRGQYVFHDDVNKWKLFLHYWTFVRGIHRSPVNSTHKGQWRGALMFWLICAWINGWVNNNEAGDFRRHSAHHDVTVMPEKFITTLIVLSAMYHNLKEANTCFQFESLAII